MRAYTATGRSGALYQIDDRTFLFLRVDPPIVTRPTPRDLRIEGLLQHTPSVAGRSKS